MRTATLLKWTFLFCFLNLSFLAFSQDELFDLLEEEETIAYASSTFKGSRIINLQSTELAGAGDGQFTILHRFGAVNDDPLYNFFGLDVASVRLSFDYSFTDWLNIGLGRSSGTKMYDGWTKVRLLRQSTGKKVMPVSVLYYGSIHLNTTKFSDNHEHFFSERLSYVNQLIVARKFSNAFSLEVAPTVVHFNVRETNSQRNTLFGLGLGGRYKITNRIAITGDYMWQVTRNTRLVDGVEDRFNNALSIGVDIETGGHVFQLHLTNARAMSDPIWMMNTPGDWLKGDIFFGFNITRVFTLVSPSLPVPPSFLN